MFFREAPWRPLRSHPIKAITGYVSLARVHVSDLNETSARLIAVSTNLQSQCFQMFYQLTVAFFITAL